MPNEFITPQQFVEGLMESCRKTAWSIPLSEAEHIAEQPIGGVGIQAAILTGLVVHCVERVNQQPGVPSGAD